MEHVSAGTNRAIPRPTNYPLRHIFQIAQQTRPRAPPPSSSPAPPRTSASSPHGPCSRPSRSSPAVAAARLPPLPPRPRCPCLRTARLVVLARGPFCAARLPPPLRTSSSSRAARSVQPGRPAAPAASRSSPAPRRPGPCCRTPRRRHHPIRAAVPRHPRRLRPEIRWF